MGCQIASLLVSHALNAGLTPVAITPDTLMLYSGAAPVSASYWVTADDGATFCPVDRPSV